ncbi:unnamed protein product [Dracunculus medinensis]|uniref:Exonuclease domain-containing protein n=1 Tax=Dracunculus medinensis TaxID=318479 RepID=A0A0N4U2F6_DRAME|nr:unnamed protein product [Dracunculus medinensis]
MNVLNLLTKYTKKGMCPLAGSSVSVDRLFINRQMQNLAAHLHYRTIDVSSFKEIVKRWYPEKYATMPAKIGKHRAVDDILESIEELKWYCRNIFKETEIPVQ